MNRNLLVGLLVGTLLLWGAGARAEDDFAKMLIKKADKLFKKRGEGDKVATAQEAKEAYEKVLAVAPEDVEARWKLARILYWIGNHTRDDEAKKKIFEEGIRYSQEALQRDDNCMECHFWLGVSYGKFGEVNGILNSLGLVPYVEESMKKVLSLDEQYEQAGAYRVLGRLCHKVPGRDDEAKEYLLKAIEVGPDNLMNYRFLAEFLLDEGSGDEDKAEAKRLLEKIINAKEEDFPRGRKPDMLEEQDKAGEILQKVFN